MRPAESYVCDLHCLHIQNIIINHGITLGLYTYGFSLTFPSEKNPVHNTMLSKFEYICQGLMKLACVFLCFSIDVHCETGWAAHAV